MSSHRARVYREGNWWVIEVAGVGVTQAKSLDKVEEMARYLVADMQGTDIDQVEVTVELPDGLGEALEEARRKSRRASELAQEAAEEQRLAVTALITEHSVPAQDVAKILRVSKGRVSQIVNPKSKRKRIPA